MRAQITGETPEQGRVVFDITEMEQACDIIELLLKKIDYLYDEDRLREYED